MGANLSDDVIECIICAICSNEDDPNIAEQKALAILDEALEQENRNNDYSNGGGRKIYEKIILTTTLTLSPKWL